MGFAADITGTLSGLLPNQQALISGLAAPANARTARRVERSTDSATLTPAGELVPIALIREAVQECLQESIQDATGALYALMADDEVVELLHKLLGRPGEKETVGRTLQEVVDAFAALAARDGQPGEVVDAIETFIARLKATARQLGDFRERARKRLAETIALVNRLLARIAETNRQIVLALTLGQDAAPHRAALQALLAELAHIIDFASFRREDGTVAVFTKYGVALVAGDCAQITGGEDGLRVGAADIGGQLVRGSLQAHFRSEGVVLPNVRSQLDTLAQTLQSRINQLTNRAIAGADARATYRGTRPVADPAGERVMLGGGDCVLTLSDQNGKVLDRTSLAMIIRLYRRQAGLPGAGPWPVGQVAASLGRWLGRILPGSGDDLAQLSAEGRLQIDLPAGSGLRLAMSDCRSLALRSKVFADPDKPLGLGGALALADGLGNEFSSGPARGGLPVVPSDGLGQIAAKIGRAEGLAAQILAVEAGTVLVVTGASGSDLLPEPESGSSLVAALGLAPAEDQANEDVAVHLIRAQPVSALTSRPFASDRLPLGMEGSLILRDQQGGMLAFQTVAADWSLARLAERLAEGSDPRLMASLVTTGNRFALRLASASVDDRFVIEGWPEGWQSGPHFDFTAAGGDIAISIDARPPLKLALAPGMDFAAIAQAINAEEGGLKAAGLRAQVLRAGNAAMLDIGHRGGLPLSFAGNAVGKGPGLIDLRYNLRDQLGLAAQAEMVVPGLCNFFGLNDLFIADPAAGFDSKAAIGVFTTTAPAGIAEALGIDPALAADPARLGSPATIRQISDLLNNAVNIAAAGDLPRGGYRLAQYADAIAAGVQSHAAGNQAMRTYQQALLNQLSRQKAADIDVNDRLQALMTLQQTYQDSTQLAAGLSRFADALRAPMH